MKEIEEVEEFKEKTHRQIIQKCKKCGGVGKRGCSCKDKFYHIISAYEACIPRTFWFTKKSDVVYNKRVFNEIILKYTSKLSKALIKGYGLILVGNNGSGKSFFSSYILMEAIKQNKYTYYTTTPQLEHDLKRGWKNEKIMTRLEQMMGSAFVVVDELGKEFENRDKDNFMISQIERFLKKRFDDGYPTILASNKGVKDLEKLYGETFSSMMKGKYKTVGLSSKDYRVKLGKKMNKEFEL